MDHQMKLIALLNWVAMKDPSKRELACMLANMAGLIARQDIDDEGEDPMDRERVTETLRADMEAGFDRRIDLLEHER